MKTYFLDTSAIVDYLRGKKEIIEKINSLEGNLVSSYVCLAELFEGVYYSKNKEKVKKIILNFFRGLNKIFDIDEKIAEKFGSLRKELRKKGKLIEDIDIFIASICIVNNLILVTLNKKHFKKIEKLQILDES
ncbi:MAG: type II toxin-antitoxin system VapC family toxin [Patescibacteria group bacterium]|nr:type II toxin-antitoxin system VapC family toxin [Patescibacteria group bacterium]